MPAMESAFISKLDVAHERQLLRKEVRVLLNNPADGSVLVALPRNIKPGILRDQSAIFFPFDIGYAYGPAEMPSGVLFLRVAVRFGSLETDRNLLSGLSRTVPSIND